MITGTRQSVEYNMTRLAVILSARKERGSDTPFPLLPLNDGKCLIDRTLELLDEIGISKVLLVIGYRTDLFAKYQRDNVQLIYAPGFEFSASMASLAAAQEFIHEDFILVEGDTFFEKRALEHLARIEKGNCLVATEESGSGDECYIESRSGFITKISKDKHRICNFEGELLGISRISHDTFRKMLACWEESTNSYLNYEYVFMDVTSPLDRPFVFFKNLIWGDVDCRDDFKRLKEVTFRALKRKEDPFDKENLQKHLADIFPDSDVTSAEFIQIGGMSNKNFLVNFKGDSFVLRVPGPGSEGMLERANEEFNALEACKLGINPTIRYFNPTTGVKLADFVKNAETLNSATIQRHDNLCKISAIYHSIHDAHIRLKNEFNLFQEIEKYDSLIKAHGRKMYEGWERHKVQIMNLESRLNSIGIDLTPCHNDAVPENFLKTEDGNIYLIDWEYSGMNDPLADIAALFLESNFPQEAREFFLTQYYQGKVPPNTVERILCYEILWDSLWAQWAVIKEACGDDFGSYGKDRYDRSLNNLLKLQNNAY